MSHELLRPEPPRDWRARLGDLRAQLPLSIAGLVAASLGAVAAIGLGVVGLRLLRSPPPAELSLPRAMPPAGVSATTTVPGPVVVYVAGAVARPGVYPVGSGARVADAVAAAGGTTPDADLDPLNLATRLSDGDRVFVPHRGQAPTGGSDKSTYVIVRCDVRRDVRIVSSFNISMIGSTKRQEDVIPTTVEMLPGGRERQGRLRDV